MGFSSDSHCNFGDIVDFIFCRIPIRVCRVLIKVQINDKQVVGNFEIDEKHTFNTSTNHNQIVLSNGQLFGIVWRLDKV